MVGTLKVVTAPGKLAVSADEFVAQSREISSTAEVAVIERYIRAATREFERQAGITIHDTEYEYVLNCWPCCNHVVLPRAVPLLEIVSVKYFESDGTERTLSGSAYIVDTHSEPGRLVLAYGESWPSFTAYPVAPIRIRYRAGIDTSAYEHSQQEADDDIKTGILLMVAGSYENRESDLADPKIVIDGRARKYIEGRRVEYVF
jgi:uncharacterized phiE125 gp8 family phage protein